MGRLAVAVLLSIQALYFTIVAFGNVTDYGTNFAFVEHVMSMDTTFRDEDLMWRAVTSGALHHAAYVGIIAWECATAVVLWAAAVLAGLASISPARGFGPAQRLALLGLLMSILLWAGAFLTVGGEWFAMWQSEDWNGLDAATRVVTFTGIALIVNLLPSAAAPAGGGKEESR